MFCPYCGLTWLLVISHTLTRVFAFSVPQMSSSSRDAVAVVDVSMVRHDSTPFSVLLRSPNVLRLSCAQMSLIALVNGLIWAGSGCAYVRDVAKYTKPDARWDPIAYCIAFIEMFWYAVGCGYVAMTSLSMPLLRFACIYGAACGVLRMASINAQSPTKTIIQDMLALGIGSACHWFVSQDSLVASMLTAMDAVFSMMHIVMVVVTMAGVDAPVAPLPPAPRRVLMIARINVHVDPRDNITSRHTC